MNGDEVPDEFAQGHYVCPGCGAHFDAADPVDGRTIRFVHSCEAQPDPVVIELVPDSR